MCVKDVAHDRMLDRLNYPANHPYLTILENMELKQKNERLQEALRVRVVQQRTQNEARDQEEGRLNNHLRALQAFRDNVEVLVELLREQDVIPDYDMDF